MHGFTYFFLFLLQNIDCEYSLEPPQKNIKFFQLKKFQFKAQNLCLLHGHVFVMQDNKRPNFSILLNHEIYMLKKKRKFEHHEKLKIRLRPFVIFRLIEKGHFSVNGERMTMAVDRGCKAAIQIIKTKIY